MCKFANLDESSMNVAMENILVMNGLEFKMASNSSKVMYDAYTLSGEPTPTNKQYNSVKICSHPDIAAGNHGMVLSKSSSFCKRILSGPLTSLREFIPSLRKVNCDAADNS
ncbi:glutamine synthetase nodule isozyme-like isoform X2 [Olea europaea var. sylvestris]|uniref:glutamine synthetase nodule isozyme-like isoform X2 n=1 Tax=Olea europaea var. sylvestris TaxID=158386 RepID=UPI000C1CD6F2|nr:glutamine synthetase nodule isozyme-like isoform X2 [Olea europaea var. sylvestris]